MSTKQIKDLPLQTATGTDKVPMQTAGGTTGHVTAADLASLGGGGNREYLFAKKNTGQVDPAVSDKVTFEVVDRQVGVDVDVDDATIIGFTADEDYMLEAQTRISNASSGAFFELEFVDLAASGIGRSNTIRAMNDGNSVGNAAITKAIFSPTGGGPFQVQLQVLAKFGTGDLGQNGCYLTVRKES